MPAVSAPAASPLTPVAEMIEGVAIFVPIPAASRNRLYRRRAQAVHQWIRSQQNRVASAAVPPDDALLILTPHRPRPSHLRAEFHAAQPAQSGLFLHKHSSAFHRDQSNQGNAANPASAAN